MTRQYNNGGTTSDVGGTVDGRPSGQLSGDFYYQKKALIEAQKEMYFSQLADVTSMPKHMGKQIKRYHYIPMLDVQNNNDQGIDAAGVTLVPTEMYVTFPNYIAVPTANVTAAVNEINANINSATKTAQVIASAGAVDGANTIINMTQRANIRYASTTQTNAIAARNLGVTILPGHGNLYGSSKDIGTINGKLPVLSENGGRVNRVGFKRKELVGTLEKFGFFDEYTQESVDFDSDEDLLMHVNREMVMAANEMNEDALQIDLLTSAGINRWCGPAMSDQTMGASNVVSYSDLMRLSIDLDDNRTPKQTTVITGTRMVDTKTLPACRVAYIGSELLPTLKAMKDLHNLPAWTPVEKYAAGGTTLRGEEGAIDNFRFVVVPEMMKWAGAGANAAGIATHRETNERFDIFPILVVGEGSFTTIGFQTDGKSVKFKIIHKKPGEATADRTDPYGETGFMAIKWYYGFMVLRPERIAVLKTTAAA